MTGFGALVFATARRATANTSVSSTAPLLSGSGSAVLLPATARLTRLKAVCSVLDTWTATVKDSLAPTPSGLGIVHTTIPEPTAVSTQLAPLKKRVPKGSVSVTCTFAAGLGPRLVTVSV